MDAKNPEDFDQIDSEEQSMLENIEFIIEEDIENEEEDDDDYNEDQPSTSKLSPKKDAKDKIHFNCGICNKSFVSMSKLERHQMYHYQIKEHECLDCGKAFTEKSMLVRHQRDVHKMSAAMIKSGEVVTYRCLFCDAKFNHNWLLERHRKRNHQNMTCNICNEKFEFKNLAHYHSHMRYHGVVNPSLNLNQQSLSEDNDSESSRKKSTALKSKPSKPRAFSSICDECGVTFNRSSDLERHVLGVHQQSGKYKCSVCGHVTAQPSQMDRHLKTKHSQPMVSMAYCCLEQFDAYSTNCPFTTTDKNQFTKHLSTHDIEKPHLCPYCKEYFPDSVKMFNRHIAANHYQILSTPQKLTSPSTRPQYQTIKVTNREEVESSESSSKKYRLTPKVLQLAKTLLPDADKPEELRKMICLVVTNPVDSQRPPQKKLKLPVTNAAILNGYKQLQLEMETPLQPGQTVHVDVPRSLMPDYKHNKFVITLPV